MVRPILIHSSEVEVARELGGAVASAQGVCVVNCSSSEELLSRGWRSADGGVVFTLPSGAMLDREFRVDCLSKGIVVHASSDRLSAVDAALQAGLGCSVTGSQRLRELVKFELQECHVKVDARGVGIKNAVDAILGVAARVPVAVAAGERSYLVEVGRGILERALGARELGGPVALYVSDENVDRLHGERLRAAVASTGLRTESVVVVPGERSKSLETLGRVFDVALGGGIDRSCWVVAAGGGVVTDLSGLVAALWMRGVRWLGIPTTLLSMVDASVGGKTAVDFGSGKNAVGAFWQPSLVVCDVDWLSTESERNYVGALAEVVKTALIGDAELFYMLESHADRIRARDPELLVEVVRRCVQVKARVVGLDERESGLRAVLNLGHTVGHALEALGGYERYTHGEAVSLGLVAALRLGERLGHTSQDVGTRVESLLARLGLPVVLPREEMVGASELLGHDKKRAGSALRFVFVRGVGEVFTARVMLEDVRELVCSLGA